MVTPIENPREDPRLKRGALLVRLSGAIPTSSILFLALIATVSIDKPPPRQLVVGIVAVLCAIGNILAWSGVLFLRPMSSWLSGSNGILWLAAVTNTLTASIALPYAIAYPFLILPWAPPVTCTIMKRQHGKRRQEETLGR